jgi:hypothetical protein
MIVVGLCVLLVLLLIVFVTQRTSMCLYSANTVGRYGFLTKFFLNPTEIVQLVDDMMTVYGITDIQFQDWFPNYSGRYQSFTDVGQGTAIPMPNWWFQKQWKDPWFQQNVIYADTLRAAIQRIHYHGGRAWAYVQSQGSEFYNLAGPPEACISFVSDEDATYGPNKYNADTTRLDLNGDPTVDFAIFHDFTKNYQLEKIIYDDQWKCQTGLNTDGTVYRIIPAYMANEPLAAYQCNAWVEVVKEYNFDGIHWDTMLYKDNDKKTQDSALQFLTRSNTILQRVGLLQTFNDINGAFNIYNQVEFLYREIWNPDAEKLYYNVIDLMGAPNTVIAMYPGTTKFGCPSKYCPQVNGKNISQEELIMLRWNAAKAHHARYLIMGNGQDRLVTEYFPGSIEMTDDLKQFMQLNAA